MRKSVYNSSCNTGKIGIGFLVIALIILILAGLGCHRHYHHWEDHSSYTTIDNIVKIVRLSKYDYLFFTQENDQKKIEEQPIYVRSWAIMKVDIIADVPANKKMSACLEVVDPLCKEDGTTGFRKKSHLTIHVHSSNDIEVASRREMRE